MANTVLCKYCVILIQEKCAKIERLTNRHAIDIKCRKCKGCHETVENQKEKLHDDV